MQHHNNQTKPHGIPSLIRLPSTVPINSYVASSRQYVMPSDIYPVKESGRDRSRDSYKCQTEFQFTAGTNWPAVKVSTKVEDKYLHAPDRQLCPFQSL